MERDNSSKKSKKKLSDYLRVYTVLLFLAFVLSFAALIAQYLYTRSVGKMVFPLICAGISTVVAIVMFIMLKKTFELAEDLDNSSVAIKHMGNKIIGYSEIYPTNEFISKVDAAINSNSQYGTLVAFDFSNFEFLSRKKDKDTKDRIINEMLIKAIPEDDPNLKHIVGAKSSHEFFVYFYDTKKQSEDGRKRKEPGVAWVANNLAAMNEVPLEYFKGNDGTVSVECGYALYPEHGSNAVNLVMNADFALSEAGFFKLTTMNEFSKAVFEKREVEYSRIALFKTLLKKNAFIYNYQPIVDSRNGEIVAYEALLRTTPEIGMSPLEVLDIADKQNKLYDIERLTFFNACEILPQKRELFGKRKLFVNSIPNHSLMEPDISDFIEKYRDYSDKIVVEITESEEEKQGAFEELKANLSRFGAELAIDDYGSGYANTGTLINYNPKYVKIDRSLISNIDTDIKKQHMFSTIVSYCKQHGISCLAEGVETQDEVKSVIKLGADLLQGFYLAKPNRELLPELPFDIVDDIIKINLAISTADYRDRVYTVENEKQVDLLDLAINKYTGAQVLSRDTTFTSGGREVTFSLTLEDNFEGRIYLKDVNMRGNHGPSITIGENSYVTIMCEGKNTLSYAGIRVPASSRCAIQGTGELVIKADGNNSVGFGGNLESSYGKLRISYDGNIRIESNGDSAVAIGGLYCENSNIKLMKGNIEVISTGDNALGIGALDGDASIEINSATVNVTASGTRAVGLGTLDGSTKISIESDVKVRVSGNEAVGIGSLKNGSGTINVIKGVHEIIFNAMHGVGIGSISGNIDITVNGGVVSMHGEGTNITGIGNIKGGGDTYITNGILDIDLLGANAIALGGEEATLRIAGGNIKADGRIVMNPTNEFGQPLVQRIINSDGTTEFRTDISCSKGAYTYIARKYSKFSNYYIYIPEKTDIG